MLRYVTEYMICALNIINVDLNRLVSQMNNAFYRVKNVAIPRKTTRIRMH